MQVLELGEQLGEGGQVARRAAIVDAVQRLFGEEAREDRELQQLVEHTRKGVVGVLRQHRVALGQRTGPFEQPLVLRFAQLVCEGFEAKVVVVGPDVELRALGPLPHLRELREQEDQRAYHQADLFAFEEHVRARRIDRHTLAFEEARQRHHAVVLH